MKIIIVLSIIMGLSLLLVAMVGRSPPVKEEQNKVIDIATNFAGLILQPENGTSFHGVRGTVSVYNPKTEKDQMSVATIWVRNNYLDNMNLIAVGWHVLPQLYNDDKTHLFAYWMTNNTKRGCHNLECPGFVQTDKTITLGQSFNQTSTIGGSTVEISLAILQDPNTKDWWININEKNIGYYPSSLFSNMASADQVAWFGKTTNPVNAPTPPMGSGFLPDGNMNHACYFKNLAFVDNSRQDQELEKNMGQLKISNPEWFNAGLYATESGSHLQFGGPGGGKSMVKAYYHRFKSLIDNMHIQVPMFNFFM